MLWILKLLFNHVFMQISDKFQFHFASQVIYILQYVRNILHFGTVCQIWAEPGIFDSKQPEYQSLPVKLNTVLVSARICYMLIIDVYHPVHLKQEER